LIIIQQDEQTLFIEIPTDRATSPENVKFLFQLVQQMKVIPNFRLVAFNVGHEFEIYAKIRCNFVANDVDWKAVFEAIIYVQAAHRQPHFVDSASHRVKSTVGFPKRVVENVDGVIAGQQTGQNCEEFIAIA
jgi:hypothetical protein